MDETLTWAFLAFLIVANVLAVCEVAFLRGKLARAHADAKAKAKASLVRRDAKSKAVVESSRVATAKASLASLAVNEAVLAVQGAARRTNEATRAMNAVANMHPRPSP